MGNFGGSNINNGLEFQGLPRDSLVQVNHRMDMQLGGGLKQVKLPLDEVNGMLESLGSIKEEIHEQQQVYHHPVEIQKEALSRESSINSVSSLNLSINSMPSPNIQTLSNRTKKVTPKLGSIQNLVQNTPQGYARVQPPVAAKTQLIRSPSSS